MTRSDIEKYARRLHSRVPLLGTHLRRSACRKLAKDVSASVMPHLIAALHADDPEVRSIATAALRGLRDASAIDVMCAQWMQGRDTQLGAIITERGYVARQPVTVRALAALQANRLDVAGERAVAIAPLVAARQDRDAALAHRAQEALRQLTNAEAIDALCAQWAQGREMGLGAIIAEQGYVARQPVTVRMLSALQANRFDVAVESVATLQSLVEALQDREAHLATQAEVALRRLSNTEYIDALCELAIADPEGLVAAIVKAMDYQPQSVSRRCVLFVLTGQLERYLELDFEFQHLRAEYQAGDEELRQRIGNVIRRSGDRRLIGLFQVSRQRKLASELTEAEATIVLDVHARNRQWPEIFTLLFHIPLASAVAALDILGRSAWRPQNNVEATLLDELFEIRATIDDMSGEFLVPFITLGSHVQGVLAVRGDFWSGDMADYTLMLMFAMML